MTVGFISKLSILQLYISRLIMLSLL